MGGWIIIAKGIRHRSGRHGCSSFRHTCENKVGWGMVSSPGKLGDRAPVLYTPSCQKSKFGPSNKGFTGVSDKAVSPGMSATPPIANGVL